LNGRAIDYAADARTAAVPGFEPRDQDFEQRVRGSFRRQKIMETIGAALTFVAPGQVEIELPFRDSLTQQHGYLHAGVITTVADSACGYAALSLFAADAEVLTVEYKVNFLAPAQGTRFVARGRVLRSGRTVSVCAAEVVAVNAGAEVPVAMMLATMIRSTSGPS
jgi:uncharacterized protein (TIGR00369 family)